MKSAAQYVALCLAIIALLAGIAAAFATGPSRQAVLVSATLAFVVQMVAFTVARLVPPAQVMVGWGLGTVLRMMVVVAYGIVVAKVWRTPVAPALLSFVVFVFVTTVVEPAFLRR